MKYVKLFHMHRSIYFLVFLFSVIFSFVFSNMALSRCTERERTRICNQCREQGEESCDDSDDNDNDGCEEIEEITANTVDRLKRAYELEIEFEDETSFDFDFDISSKNETNGMILYTAQVEPNGAIFTGMGDVYGENFNFLIPVIINSNLFALDCNAQISDNGMISGNCNGIQALNNVTLTQFMTTVTGAPD